MSDRNHIHMYRFGPHYRYLEIYTALPTGERISVSRMEPDNQASGERRARYEQLVVRCKEEYPRLRLTKYVPSRTEERQTP